jgi:hypothetical protein
VDLLDQPEAPCQQVRRGARGRLAGPIPRVVVTSVRPSCFLRAKSLDAPRSPPAPRGSETALLVSAVVWRGDIAQPVGVLSTADPPPEG